jgi:aspartyl-tRNA synthetase
MGGEEGMKPESMSGLKRTHTCGELRGSDVGKRVVVMGWVQRQRNLGGLIFVDVRDRYGVTQAVFRPELDSTLHEKASKLAGEYVVAVEGEVARRPEDMLNPDMDTGEIEVVASRLLVLNPSATPPFVVEDDVNAMPDLRLKYRYLDLRRPTMQRNIRLRHIATQAARSYLNSIGFLEIDTPMLAKKTPEGARNFLVPSRVNPGKVYALPQSPQLYKQVLMASGFDKYYQIARCLRDEDLRADRQPEHTQIDIEMSFVTQDDVFEMTEGLMAAMFKETLSVELKRPFPRFTYEDAMNRFGTDKPDLRIPFEIRDLTDRVEDSGFRVFADTVADGGSVKALAIPGSDRWSRKRIDEMEEVAKEVGAKGLAWARVRHEADDSGGEKSQTLVLEGGISRFLEPEEQRRIIEAGDARAGDLLLMVAAEAKTALQALGELRLRVGEELGYRGSVEDREGVSGSKKIRGEKRAAEAGSGKDEGKGTDSGQREFAFCWIVDFPLFAWNEEAGEWEAEHHMFSMPREEDIGLLDTDPGSVKGQLYDVVCNGVELASGSVRIHRRDVQEKVMKVVGLTPEQAEERFGFLLKAFEYGAPPHGGIAPGLDRIVMIIAGEDSIREVIPFPKTAKGVSLMDGSPSPAEDIELKELHLKWEGLDKDE